MNKYTYIRSCPTLTRVLQYREGEGWYYREFTTDRCTMPADVGEWMEWRMTPERSDPRRITVFGEDYRLTDDPRYGE